MLRFGKPPPRHEGAWITKPVCNWSKATELLTKHDASDWHKASLIASSLAEKGDIIQQMQQASREEIKKNRELLCMLITSLYFLTKHRLPHTTTLEDLIVLQIENGNALLGKHKETGPGNATYLSKVSTAELLTSISFIIEKHVLDSLKMSEYFSVLADENTDISSQEEMSICGRWVEKDNVVERFLGMIHIKKADAETIADSLLQFLSKKKLRGIGFDGASTMSWHRSGVQLRIRCRAPGALYVHCHCHRLQLAVVKAASEHKEIDRVMGTMLTLWKCFYNSPKKAEKLFEIQEILDCPE